LLWSDIDSRGAAIVRIAHLQNADSGLHECPGVSTASFLDRRRFCSGDHHGYQVLLLPPHLTALDAMEAVVEGLDLATLLYQFNRGAVCCYDSIPTTHNRAVVGE
jgi:hypothetical protein